MRKRIGLIKRINSIIATAALICALMPTELLPMSKVEAASVTYIPLTISSGFNTDVIFTKGESVSTQTSFYNTTLKGAGFYLSASGASALRMANSTKSLPDNGLITQDTSVGAAYAGLKFQLGDYKKANTLQLAGGGNSGTLKFSEVGVFEKVYILANAGGVGAGNSATMNVVITYSDNTTSKSTFTVYDNHDYDKKNTSVWYKYGRYAENATSTWATCSKGHANCGCGIMFRCAMNVDTTRLINNIKITNSTSNTKIVVNVFAVTGATAAIDAPTGLTLNGCEVLNATWDPVPDAASYRIDIATDNNFTQIVGSYNNKVVDTNSIQVKGLTLGQTYHARVRAVTSSGGQGPSSPMVDCVANFKWTCAARGNEFDVYCSIPGCDYDISAPMVYTLEASNAKYDRRAHSAILKAHNTEDFGMTGYTASAISYHSTLGANTTSGGTSLNGRTPRDVGFYYATVDFTKEGESTPHTIATPYKIYLEDANFEMENLNNRSVDLSVANSQTKAVSKDGLANGAVSNLKVILNNSADTLRVYKIASMKWNEKNQDYDDLKWDPVVTAWRSEPDNSDYSGATYDSPNALMNTTSSNQQAFYNALVDDSSTLWTNDSAEAFVNHPVKTSATSTAGSDEEYGEYSYAYFSDLDFGTYVVVGNVAGGEARYSPLVVNVIPYQNGPHTKWYVPYEFVAVLKESAGTVDKRINNHDESDIVAFNDTVNFDITMTLPSVYKDRVTLSASPSIKDYTLILTDEMSAAFEYVPGTATVTYTLYSGDSVYKKVIESETIQYKDMAFRPEIAGNVPYIEFADASYAGAKTDITDDNKAQYGYDTPKSEHITDWYAVSKTGALYTIEEPSEANGNKLKLIWNMHALKGFLALQNSLPAEDPGKIMPGTLSATNFEMKLHYQATVTDQIKVNSEDNTNTVKMEFEKSNGSIDSIYDTVRAYTYGINLKKIDGETYQTDDETYLPNARFKLYKWEKNFALDSTDDELATIQADISTQGSSSDYYIYETADAHKIFKVYTNAFLDDAIFTELNMTRPKYNGTFNSIANEKGVNLNGLTDGKYILMEVDAPFGYNGLAEDIYFEINRLNEDEANTQYHGSLAAFREMDDALNDSGTLLLDVLNYKGLMLPSTGGAGTLLFTIIGMVIMMSVVITLLLRRHTRSAADYM